MIICPVSFIPKECLSNLNESVWLANVETLETLILNNVSKTPYHSFVLSASETQEVRSKSFPWVLCHTHVHPHSLMGFSVEDNYQIDKLPQLGHFMYQPLTGHYSFLLSKEFETMAPYEGRQWDWSCRNCYTLVKDWYQREKSIILPPTHLEHPLVCQTDSTWDVYQESLPKYGFTEVKRRDSLNGDLILMRLGRTHNPNHIGVLIKEEGEPNKILHHSGGRTSRIEVISEIFDNLIVSVWQHGK